MKRLVQAIFASLLLVVSFPILAVPSPKPVADDATVEPKVVLAPRAFTVPTSQHTVPLESVIRIRCGKWTGTAQVIDGDTLLTASHVVGGNKVCTYEDKSGVKTLSVAFDHVKLDYAVLYGDTGKRKRIPLNCDGFITGQPYIAIGFPHGTEFALHAMIAEDGYGNSRDDKTGLEFNHTRQLRGLIDGRPAAIPGMSGGPIMNLFGQIVGTVIATPKDDSDPHVFARELKDTYLCEVKGKKTK